MHSRVAIVDRRSVLTRLVPARPGAAGRMAKLIRRALFLCAMGSVLTARAQALWTGATNFDWNESGNWLNDGVDYFGGPPTSDGTAEVIFSTPALALPDINYIINNSTPWHVKSLHFDDLAEGAFTFQGNTLTIGEPSGVGSLSQTFLNPLASVDYPYVTFENNVTLAAPTTITEGGWDFAGQLDMASHGLTITDGALVTLSGTVANWGTLNLGNSGGLDFRDTTTQSIPTGTPIVLGTGGGVLLFPEAVFDPDDYTITYNPNLNNISGAGSLTLGGTFDSDTFLPTHTGGTILGSGCGCDPFDAIWRVGTNGLLPPGDITVNFGSFIELNGNTVVFDTSSPGATTGNFFGMGDIYLDRYRLDNTRNGGLMVFLTADAGDTLRLEPSVTDSGIARDIGLGQEPGAIYKDGPGTLEIGSASIDAAFYLNGGTVKMTSLTPPDPSPHFFGKEFVMAAGATLNVSDQVVAINNLSGEGEILIGEQAEFFGNDVPNLSFAGDSTYNGVIKDETPTLLRPGSLMIANGTNGAVTLTAASTYSGDTLIDGGRLDVRGSLVSRVLVKPELPIAVDEDFGTQSILTGKGTIGGLLVSQSGIIDPADTDVASPHSPLPATLTVAGNAVFEGGGIYNWRISNATGTQGANPGWSHLNITGTLEIEASAANKFQIFLNSMDPCGCLGPLEDGFDSSLTYTWTIASAAGGITMTDGTDPVTFDPAAFDINTDGFAHPMDGGTFSVSLGGGGNDLNLTFTPVPEPRDFALIFGIGLAGFAVWRRSRKSVA